KESPTSDESRGRSVSSREKESPAIDSSLAGNESRGRRTTQGTSREGVPINWYKSSDPRRSRCDSISLHCNFLKILQPSSRCHPSSSATRKISLPQPSAVVVVAPAISTFARLPSAPSTPSRSRAIQKPSPCLFLFDNCCSPATIVVATSRCPVVLPALLLNSTNHCHPSPAIASLGLQQLQPSLIAPDVDATTSSASLSAFLYRRLLLLLPTPSSTTCSPRSLHIVAAVVLSTRAQQCRHCFSLPIHIALNCTLLFPFSTTVVPYSLLPQPRLALLIFAAVYLCRNFSYPDLVAAIAPRQHRLATLVIEQDRTSRCCFPHPLLPLLTIALFHCR
ncbi:hypothetical protein B296_00047060, partial [Ensete ventricosum]